MMNMDMPTSTDPIPRLALRVGEAAEAVGLGKTKLYELIGRGEIQAIRVDGMMRVPVSALREWVDAKLRAERPAPPIPAPKGRKPRT